MQYIKKRDGRLVEFNKNKIVDAVCKAFKDVDGEISNYAVEKAGNIANYIEKKIIETQEILTVEQIQDYVENGLMSLKKKDVAKAYIYYRQMRTYARENTIEKTIEEIVQGTSEYWNGENSNKNPQLATTQRDYIAGAVSTDLTRRRLLPQDIVEAHDQGIIHFHDADYYVQTIHNCDLINL